MTPLENLFNQLSASGQSADDFFKELFIVSACSLDIDDEDEWEEEEWDDEELDEELEEEDEEIIYDDMNLGIQLQAGKADGKKCPRCWQWEVTDHQHSLCDRCQQVIAKMDPALS